MEPFIIYIVDDDELYLKVLYYILTSVPTYEVHTFKNAKEVLNKLEEKIPHLVCIDFNLPEKNGMELIKEIKKNYSSIPIIVISGQDSIDIAVDLMNSGIYNYIVKDRDTKNKLWINIRNIKENIELRNNYKKLLAQIEGKKYLNNIIIGNTEKMLEINNIISKAVISNINIVFEGENGVGKEYIAKVIHDNSKFSGGPFIDIDVSTIDEYKIEAELFGSSTEKNGLKTGIINNAQNGTIYIEDFTTLNHNMQNKLLRLMQDGEYSKKDSNKKLKNKSRIVLATEKDLDTELKNGKLLKDLYYLIKSSTVYVPALRERKIDIPLLANFFIEMFCQSNNLEIHTLTQNAIDKLLSYDYPGNIRELKSIIEVAIVYSNDNIITEDEIKFLSKSLIISDSYDNYTLEDYSNRIISEYLKNNNNNIGLVANMLNIGKSTIYRLIKEGKVINN